MIILMKEQYATMHTLNQILAQQTLGPKYTKYKRNVLFSLIACQQNVQHQKLCVVQHLSHDDELSQEISVLP